jgi:type IV pilus assembly protein PilA
VRNTTLAGCRGRFDDHRGFTLVEILVVILIIGILAALAIPSFFQQKNKANDAGAKVIVRTAQTVMEDWATNNNGSYSGATLSALNSLEPGLITSSSSQAYLQSVIVPSATVYTVVAYQPTTGDSYSVVDSGSVVNRYCTTAGNGGCPSGGSW